MQTQPGSQVTLPSDREIKFTRTFDAPPALVFEMWTHAEHVTNWWDPNGLPLEVCDIDLRTGGDFRFVNANTGGKHVFAGTYREITPTSRLVFSSPAPLGGASTGTLSFDGTGDTTELTLTIACPTKADRDALLSMRVDAGTARTLDNLETYVRTRMAD